MYKLLLAIGIVVMFIVGTILGIQFMVASAEDKAKVKEALIPYVVGCFVIFGAFTIWGTVVNIGQDIMTAYVNKDEVRDVIIEFSYHSSVPESQIPFRKKCIVPVWSTIQEYNDVYGTVNTQYGHLRHHCDVIIYNYQGVDIREMDLGAYIKNGWSDKVRVWIEAFDDERDE